MQVKKLGDYFVRIVILNYNESHYTISLIKQLKNQSFANFEIVVVDNDSKLEDKNILKNELDQDITSVFSSKNLGYAAGNNLGIRKEERCPVDYFLILNNDLIIEDENFIKVLLEQIIENRDQGVVASSPIVDTISSGISVEKQIQVRRILPLNDTFLLNVPLFNFFTKKKRKFFLYKEDMPFINKIHFCDSINGAAFMIEGNFIKNIDYLDEGTFLYFEEIILGKQIKDAGKTCLLNGFTSVKHLQGVSTKSSTKKINVRMERFKYESALYYLKKYENIGLIGRTLFMLLNEITIVIKKTVK